MPDTWVVQTVDGRTKYHKIEDRGPCGHVITHTVMKKGDGTLHLEVMGRILHRDAPALLKLSKLSKNTSLKNIIIA